MKVAGVVSAFMVRSEKRTKVDFAKAEYTVPDLSALRSDRTNDVTPQWSAEPEQPLLRI